MSLKRIQSNEIRTINTIGRPKEMTLSEYSKQNPKASTIKSAGEDFIDLEGNDDASFKQYGKSLLNSINYDEDP